MTRYIEYLEEDFSNIEKGIWFFIEDITPFGNHYLDLEGNVKLFNPMLAFDIIDLFEKSSSLKGIIFATNCYSNENKIFTFHNNNIEIKKLKKICKLENIKNLLMQNPLCSSTLIKIEKNDNQGC